VRLSGRRRHGRACGAASFGFSGRQV